MSDLETAKVSVEDAIARLQIIPDYDPGGIGGPRPCVHTFRNGSGMMLGAHWDLVEARKTMEKFGVEECRPMRMGHGLFTVDDTGPIYWETKP